jgi:ribosome-binding protein aMBF1 (putative translation factor)
VDEARQQPGLSVDTLADKVLAEALMAQRNEA